MKEKTIAFLTCIFIAMSIFGFTYAQWNDVIIVNTTMTFGTLNLGFVDPLTWVDNEDAKDVGLIDCHYEEYVQDVATGKWSYRKLVTELANAYPGYEGYSTFTLENVGTLPVKITDVVVSDFTNTLKWVEDATNPAKGVLVDTATDKAILNLELTPDPIEERLEPQPYTPTTLEVTLYLRVNQDAEHRYAYSFQVEIIYEEAT
jgi:hypothetical protein